MSGHIGSNSLGGLRRLDDGVLAGAARHRGNASFSLRLYSPAGAFRRRAAHDHAGADLPRTTPDADEVLDGRRNEIFVVADILCMPAGWW